MRTQLKRLFDLLNSNKWVYWFIIISIALYVSTHITGKTVNDMIFAGYAPIADKVEIVLFAFLIAFIIFKRVIKPKN